MGIWILRNLQPQPAQVGAGAEAALHFVCYLAPRPLAPIVGPYSVLSRQAEAAQSCAAAAGEPGAHCVLLGPWQGARPRLFVEGPPYYSQAQASQRLWRLERFTKTLAHSAELKQPAAGAGCVLTGGAHNGGSGGGRRPSAAAAATLSASLACLGTERVEASSTASRRSSGRTSSALGPSAPGPCCSRPCRADWCVRGGMASFLDRPRAARDLVFRFGHGSLGTPGGMPSMLGGGSEPWRSERCSPSMLLDNHSFFGRRLAACGGHGQGMDPKGSRHTVHAASRSTLPPPHFCRWLVGGSKG